MITKDKELLAKVYRFTRNLEDAEDAIQGAYLYQLTHRLKRKHFMWKAFNSAKDGYRKRKHLQIDLAARISDKSRSSIEDRLAATEEYEWIYNSLTNKQKTYFKALLECEGSIIEASESLGIDKSNLKNFMSALRTGKITKVAK